MKKIYIGILAVLYVAVSSGVALELHYCMGNKAGMDIYGTANKKCGKCGMTEKKTGCCHDEFKFYKISDSHKTVSNNIDLTASSIAVVHEYHLFNWQMPGNVPLIAVNNNSPPGDTEASACIMNCVFRI
jgi:hypothetical protein